ncbi:hypothetical protein HK096_003542 [Nowakowskiella sp. JEL0078]|nr:hypothetical protein HK096_003542 [Nowakowskiella sp. JEL0078]
MPNRTSHRTSRGSLKVSGESYARLSTGDSSALSSCDYIIISHTWSDHGEPVNMACLLSEKRSFIADLSAYSPTWFDCDAFTDAKATPTQLLAMPELYRQAHTVYALMSETDSFRILKLIKFLNEYQSDDINFFATIAAETALNYTSRVWTLSESAYAKRVRVAVYIDGSYVEITNEVRAAIRRLYALAKITHRLGLTMYALNVLETSMICMRQSLEWVFGSARYDGVVDFMDVSRMASATEPDDYFYATYRILDPDLLVEFGADVSFIKETWIKRPPRRTHTLLGTITRVVPEHEMGGFAPDDFNCYMRPHHLLTTEKVVRNESDETWSAKVKLVGFVQSAIRPLSESDTADDLYLRLLGRIESTFDFYLDDIREDYWQAFLVKILAAASRAGWNGIESLGSFLSRSQTKVELTDTPLEGVQGLNILTSPLLTAEILQQEAESDIEGKQWLSSRLTHGSSFEYSGTIYGYGPCTVIAPVGVPDDAILAAEGSEIILLNNSLSHVFCRAVVVTPHAISTTLPALLGGERWVDDDEEEIDTLIVTKISH